MLRSALLTALVVASLALLAACKEPGKESEAAARADVASLVELAARDVAEVERGLPEAARRTALAIEKDGDLVHSGAAVRSLLLRLRRDVPDLLVAKSTFFALADDKGVAIRNDLEQDVMAGKSLVGAYPDLGRVLTGAPYVATQGAFPSDSPNPNGPDKEWVAGARVQKADGALVAMMVTGWTYRRFAYHLQESLKHDLQEKVRTAGAAGKMPVVYVFLYDASAAYSARLTPKGNEDAMAALGLSAKTAQGPSSGVLTLTDRSFGWAAALAPALGPGVGIAVLRSEI